MKIGIMQPYLFPYIGYFQLIKAVDLFVIYDDVNFIKRGWINRNNILVNNKPFLFSLPLSNASQNKHINQIMLLPCGEKLLKTISHSYSKAPYFSIVYPIIETILLTTENNLALFLELQLRALCTYLCLYPRWLSSSLLNIDPNLSGQHRILTICQQLDSSHYINLPGGIHLYSPSLFKSANIQLSFIQPKTQAYHQFNSSFVPNLSIIDTMMFNSSADILAMLDQYYLLTA